MPPVIAQGPTRRNMLALLATILAGPTRGMSPRQTHLDWADIARSIAGPENASLRLLIPQGSVANILPVAKHFHQLTGIEIKVTEAGTRDIGTTVLADKLRGKTTFDVVLPPTYEIPDLAVAGAIQPLDRLQSVLAPGLDDGRALYTNGDSFDSRTYGHQTDGDVLLLFLNRDLLSHELHRARYEDRFGTAFRPPVTWGELDRQVGFVANELDRPGGVFLRAQGQVEWEYWLRLHAKGIWPVSDTFNPQFNSAEGLEALEDMIAVAPFVVETRNGRQSLGDGWREFADTGAYATFGWGGTQKIFRRGEIALTERVLAVPIPGGQGSETPDTLPYFNWGWSFAITTDAENPRLALSFLRFAVAPRMSTLAVQEEGGFFDPFMKEHYEDAAIRDIYGDDFLRVHRTSLESAIPDFYIVNRAAYFDALGAWLRLALNGAIEPSLALQKASDQWRLLTDEQETQPQADRWRQLRQKYPKEIADRLRDTTPWPSKT